MRETTKKESKDLFKKIRQKKRKKRMPFTIMFELTYGCNFNCPHCYLGHQKNGKKRELNTEEIKKILDQLAELGVYRIGFTGGEPLTRPDIFEILSYANKKGFCFGLLSNGYLIDAKTADKLKKVNVDKLDITFNSMCEKTFSALSGVKNGYGRVFSAVNLLIRRQMQVSIKSTVTSINQNEIEKISAFARDKGIPYRIDGEVLPCKGGDSELVDELSVGHQAFLSLRQKIYPEMFKNKGTRKRRTRRRRNKVFNCGVGTTAFSINPYGEMNFCIEIDYPKINILKTGGVKAWNLLKEKVDQINDRAKVSGDFVCGNCKLLPYCGWCAGRSYLETGEFNRCSEFFKKRAIERKLARVKEKK
ncbi:MAG: radical SAM protein [Candidatus Omnitrophica bacterium]|nr:radical SAM protein [Candidatus Omnitrophota bacterium]